MKYEEYLNHVQQRQSLLKLMIYPTSFDQYNVHAVLGSSHHLRQVLGSQLFLIAQQLLPYHYGCEQKRSSRQNQQFQQYVLMP